MTQPHSSARSAENRRIQAAIEVLPPNTDTRKMAKDLGQKFSVSTNQVYGNISHISRFGIRIIQIIVPKKRSVIL